MCKLGESDAATKLMRTAAAVQDLHTLDAEVLDEEQCLSSATLLPLTAAAGDLAAA